MRLIKLVWGLSGFFFFWGKGDNFCQIWHKSYEHYKKKFRSVPYFPSNLNNNGIALMKIIEPSTFSKETVTYFYVSLWKSIHSLFEVGFGKYDFTKVYPFQMYLSWALQRILSDSLFSVMYSYLVLRVHSSCSLISLFHFS